MLVHRWLFRMVSIIVIIPILFSGFPFIPVAAQGNDDLKRQVNSQTGKVSFLGPQNERMLSASNALGSFLRPQDPALALAKRFGAEFGLRNPERELTEMKTNHPGEGRLTVRYQQNYQGIPVMGGELIVNTNESGDLYSMNGEVSSDLALSTEPAIAAQEAQQTALQAVAKWYQKMPEDFVSSEPELWIYDESLLRASTRPAELVWRLEVTPKDASMPVHELVVVNAHRGGISLHFNQIDTAWKTPEHTKLNQSTTSEFSSTNLVYDEIDIKHDFNAHPMPALLGVIWYVAPAGNDSNSCSSTNSPCATINEAIGKASDGDTIQVTVGTYTGVGTDVVMVDKSVTLSGGWDEAFTERIGYSTIDGQNLRRGIFIGNVTAVVEYFTIRNSVGFVPGSVVGGSAIRNQGHLTVDHSNMVENHFSRSSVIYNAPDAVFLLNNSTASYNLGVNTNPIVNNEGTFTAQGSMFERNAGMNTGSVILNVSGVMTLVDTAIRDNFGNSIWSNGTLALTRSLVSGNISEFGTGGIVIGGGTLILENTTVSGNQALVSGAGLSIGGASTVTINNSTITGNRADHGNSGNSGGISVDSSGNTVTLKNSIVARNTEYTAPDCRGPILSAGYNLIGNGLGCSFSAFASDQVGTDADPIDPQLGPLQDHGGSTFVHPLLIGSPAIDAGNPANPGSGGAACLGTDQSDTPRPAGAQCDIGAFEGSENGLSFPLILTYSAEGGTALNDVLLCTQSTQPCTGFDPYADAAHFHALGTYNLFLTKHNRKSLDDKYMPILSTVYYDDLGFGYENAAWNPVWGGVMYGGGYGWPLADDVVAHEITHGVIQYSSNLFYYYQSGAINESFADLWGEYYDQTNGMGTDTANARWLLGEDISGLNAFRSMSNPPAFDDPDRISSVQYFEGDEDSGGVHTNSGINNKAVYLMVDGGSFNGKTITTLGWDKTAAIYYEVNTNLLSSGADYSDLYYALQQACTTLIGQNGITVGDCAEVKDAIDSVEMNAQPATNFNTEAPYCQVGDPLTMVFADDLEAGAGNWSFEEYVDGYRRWQLDAYFGPFAHSGKHSLYASDSPARVTDATAQLAAFTVPEDGYLRFAQAYGFESGHNTDDPAFYHFDGGVLEYSIDDGLTWGDAGSLIDHNGYTGTIFTGAGNPLSGRSAFVGDSHGYISTRLNLSSLEGETVSFRWRMGLDEAAFDWDWWVDTVEIYTCEPPNLQVYIGGALQDGYNALPHLSERVSYVGVNNGPVKIASTNSNSIIGAERVIYRVNGVATSFSEMMGLPDSQLNTTYWLPWYNNVDLDTQLRFANVSGQPASIHVFVGNQEMPGSPFELAVGESTRVSFAGINNGPVEIVSDQNIVAAERVIYKVQGVQTSFSEMMALPEGQLDTTYWLPWYNNVDLDTQLRIGNVSGATATVHVFIGGTEVTPVSGIVLLAGESTRVSFAGINNGPVQIVSDQNIVAAERVIYKVQGVQTSFSEMMALPESQLDTTYWLPWYNNVDLDTQLRIGNVSGSTATVHVFIGGTEVTPVSGIVLLTGESTRVSYASVNEGPVQIVSDVPVVAAERVIYKVNNIQTSFSEMMGLPNSQLDTTYWLPWYNNVDLDTQLRFGMP